MQYDFGHNVLCSASLSSFASEENNSYIFLPQKFRARISYGHTTCFIHMRAVPCATGKQICGAGGLLGVCSPCRVPSVQPVTVPGMAESPEQGRGFLS